MVSVFREFITYFTKKYGKPEVVLENGSYEQDIARGKVAGPSQLGRGVIAFEISGWSNATGYVDLWDWNLCLGDFCQMKYRLAGLFVRLPCCGNRYIVH